MQNFVIAPSWYTDSPEPHQHEASADYMTVSMMLSMWQCVLKSVNWSFSSLTDSLNSPTYTPLLRDLLRRLCTLAGKPILGAASNDGDGRLDRHIARVTSELADEFGSFGFPDQLRLDEGCSVTGLTPDGKLLLLRILFLKMFDVPTSAPVLEGSRDTRLKHVYGYGPLGETFILVQDSTMDTRLWSIDRDNRVSLVGSSFESLPSAAERISRSLADAIASDIGHSICAACMHPIEKKSKCVSCKDCGSYAVHADCAGVAFPTERFCGFCQSKVVVGNLRALHEQIETTIKLESRKKRRLQSELSQLTTGAPARGRGRYGAESGSSDISDLKRGLEKNIVDGPRRRTTRGFDYSFRDYDSAIDSAIGGSDRSLRARRGSPPRELTRDERFAARARRAELLEYSSNIRASSEIAEHRSDDEQREGTTSGSVPGQGVPGQGDEMLPEIAEGFDDEHPYE